MIQCWVSLVRYFVKNSWKASWERDYSEEEDVSLEDSLSAGVDADLAFVAIVEVEVRCR